MSYKLPRTFRPRSNVYYRQFRPGADLCVGFFDDLKSIDDRLHLVWHDYRTETDPVMNEYLGEAEDPRFNIHEEHSREVWGWVLRRPDNSPIDENLWHIWELHQHGWSHVAPVLSSSPPYLSHLCHRLYLQTSIITKYGMKKYFEILRQGVDNTQAAEKADVQALNQAVMDENKWLLTSAMDNMASGRINATNPTKDIITSFSGQGNKSRIVRPLTDTEGGLILPEQWRKE